MNPALDVLLPEAEEPAQYRIARRQIETLPDEALQQVRMIRHVIQDLRGREPVMSELHREIAHRGLRRCRCHARILRSEEHTSELQSLMRISYAVLRLKQKNKTHYDNSRH